MKPILIFLFVAFALLFCSCGKSPKPVKNETSQVSQAQPSKKELHVDRLAYSGTEYVTIIGVETKTDYTNWFTWKNYDGKKENAEKAIYIWNGEEVGLGTAGFGEILKRVEAMQKPAKYKLGLSVFFPKIFPQSDSKSERKNEESTFAFDVSIAGPFKETTNEFNKIVRIYSHVDELHLAGGCGMVPPRGIYIFDFDFKKYFPFDIVRMEAMLNKNDTNVVYVGYEKKHTPVPAEGGPAPAKPEKTSPGKKN